jgi:hypothetical protein
VATIYGTIYNTFLNDYAAVSTYHQLNFTDCRIPSAADGHNGVIFYETTKAKMGSWSLRYSTLLKCAGKSGIDHSLEQFKAEMSDCNCFDNTIKSSSGLVYSCKAGVAIQNCIFSGTTSGADIFMEATATGKCTINNCWFSGDLPNAAYLTGDLSNNHANSTTESWLLVYFDTLNCPAYRTPLARSRRLLPVRPR